MFSPFNSLRPQPGTILFVDNRTAESISLTGGIASIVPSKYLMVSSIEIPPSEIKDLIERLISGVNLEHFEIFLSEKISKFSSQIAALSSFNEFDIVKIYSTNSGDSLSSLPSELQNRVSYSPSFMLNITDSISLSLNLKPNILEQITHFENSTVTGIYQTINSFIPRNNSLKFFSVGEFSKEVVNFIEKNRQQSSSYDSALLCIDRTMFSTPLFLETDSLLDFSAKINFYNTLVDSTFIQTEIKGGPQELKTKIQKLVKANEPTIESMSLAWSKLDNETKEKLTKEHPMLQSLLGDVRTSNIQQFQEMLMDGDDIEDVLCAVSSFRESLSLISFKRLITPSINIDELLNDLYQSHKSEAKKFCTKENCAEIIKSCRSGYDGKSKITSLSMMTLIKFIESLLDPNKPDDQRIESSGGGLLSFLGRGKSQSIKSFQNLFVFVIGGMSFIEIREIQKIIQSKKSSTKIFISTDTISSTIDIFAK